MVKNRTKYSLEVFSVRIVVIEDQKREHEQH